MAIFADKDNVTGALKNIMFDGCPGDTSCDCEAPHNDPSPGTTRVPLSAGPIDGDFGPFTYNAGTQTPVRNEANTKAAWQERYLDAERRKTDPTTLRTTLVGAGKDTTAVDADIAACEATKTTALTYL